MKLINIIYNLIKILWALIGLLVIVDKNVQVSLGMIIFSIPFIIVDSIVFSVKGKRLSLLILVVPTMVIGFIIGGLAISKEVSIYLAFGIYLALIPSGILLLTFDVGIRLKRSISKHLIFKGHKVNSNPNNISYIHPVKYSGIGIVEFNIELDFEHEKLIAINVFSDQLFQKLSGFLTITFEEVIEIMNSNSHQLIWSFTTRYFQGYVDKRKLTINNKNQAEEIISVLGFLKIIESDLENLLNGL